MYSNKKIFVIFSLTIFVIANYSIGLFYLPALPMIGSHFHVSRQYAQMSYPIVLIGSSLAYTYLGALSDHYGAKKMLYVQFTVYFLSSLMGYLSKSMLIFLLSLLMQGLSSYYLLIIKYCKTQLDFDVVAVLSYLSIIGTLFVPINAFLSGVIADFNWRYIFILWSIIPLVSLVLVYFLPTKSDTQLVKLDLDDYIANIKSFIKDRFFNQSLVAMVTMGSVYVVFYSLSPHIFVYDFGLTAKQYGMYLFIPTLGSLIGFAITTPLKRRYGLDGCILIGECLAFISIILFIVIFHFFTIPFVFMLLIALFMISYPLIITIVDVQIVSIYASIAGSALSLLFIGYNGFQGMIGVLAARSNGEHIGVIMLAILILGFSLYHFIKMKSKVSA